MFLSTADMRARPPARPLPRPIVTDRWLTLRRLQTGHHGSRFLITEHSISPRPSNPHQLRRGWAVIPLDWPVLVFPQWPPSPDRLGPSIDQGRLSIRCPLPTLDAAPAGAPIPWRLRTGEITNRCSERSSGSGCPAASIVRRRRPHLSTTKVETIARPCLGESATHAP